VSFSDPGKEKQEGFSSQFSGHASDHDYDSRDVEFAAAVAAAAFAIHSLEEAELEIQRKMREAFETSRTKIKSRKDETTTGFQSSRRFSNMEMKDAGKFLL
jgi:hypothetical protein